MQKHLFIYVVLLLLAAACSPVRVVSTDPPAANALSKYKTYSFAQLEKRVEVKRANSESIKEYVQQAIISEMAKRGYELTEEYPDFLIDLQMNVREFQRDQRSESRYDSRRRYYYNYGSYYGYGRGWTGPEIETNANMEADITLVFADAASKRKFWAGSAEASLASKPKKSILRLNEAIAQLVAHLQ
ncbi:MAG: DUF4136 domain-containing protein [Bacteroidetes bacterium]|nr:MAG: DUF4136 domain-containing protein [Bacteroidota bacterium]